MSTDSSSHGDWLATKMASLQVKTNPTRYANCYPEANPMDIYRAHIADIMSEISGVEPAIVYPALAPTLVMDKGDMVLPVPALRVKGRKPDELATEWLAKFPESPLVHKPVQHGSFLQFFFKVDKLAEILIPTIRQETTAYGQNKKIGLRDQRDPSKGRKKILIEFSSPNIAKPFHAGHLRSTIIGGFLSNLYEGAGWDVVRLNYLGDWGKQYGLLALGFDKYGNEEALKTDPIQHLYEVYVSINKDLAAEKDEIKALEAKGEDASKLKNEGLDEQARRYFRAMSSNDAAAIAQWARFRELSIERYKKTYARLNIHFDEYRGESMVKKEMMDKADKMLEESGIAEESDGALLIDFSKHVAGKPGKSLEKAVIRKKDGTALYLTRDISEIQQRDSEYNFDHMIYVVATQQDLNFKQLFTIVKLMGLDDLATRVQHINFGMVLGMSTRAGTVKFLDDILKEVGEKMHEVMQKNKDKYEQIQDPLATADILGISAVMVQDMSGKRINNYTFNMDVMTSFEGDTGPYLQYAHARLCSIARKAAVPADALAAADPALLTEPQAQALVRVLVQWPDVVANTLRTLEPTTVLTYLFRMTHALSSSYDHLRIVGSEPGVRAARMALYDAARQVLWNGMRLLGLSPVERM